MTISILNALAKLDNTTKKFYNIENDESDSIRFFTQGHFPASNLSVSTTGYGTLQPILSAQQAQELQRLGSPPRFGLREQTLLDPDVRSSVEIAADAIEITWAENTLETLLNDVAQELNTKHLQARLHSLLIYGQDNFSSTIKIAKKTLNW
jgi:hypothetical protein